MIEYQFISIILLYILIGMSWADFIHKMMVKSDSTTNWTRFRKRLVTILWPINFLAFVYGVIREILKTTNN